MFLHNELIREPAENASDSSDEDEDEDLENYGDVPLFARDLNPDAERGMKNIIKICTINEG